MLKQRVITAIFLLAGFLGAVFYLPSLGWAGVVTLVAALAAWEWGGLLGWSPGNRVAGGVGFALLGAGLLLAFPFLREPGMASGSLGSGVKGLYLLSLVFWCGLVPPWFRHHWKISVPGLGVGVGLVVLLPTWLALIQLRTLGGGALLALMATVWIADIAAYFSGRAFGKHKLAPSISPGKTWEGALGALVGVEVYGFILWTAFPGFLPSLQSWQVLLGLAVVTAISIFGDLFESLLKRQAGLKDSSQLLPGHGGVLDRIDSLTSTLPLFALGLFCL